MSILFLNRQIRIEGPQGAGLLVVAEPPRLGRAALARLIVDSETPLSYRRCPCRGGADMRFSGRSCRAYLITEDGIYSAWTRNADDEPDSVIFQVKNGEVRFASANLDHEPLKNARLARGGFLKEWAQRGLTPAKVLAFSRRAAISGDRRQGRAAWDVRQDLIDQALREGCVALAELIRSIRDPLWFLSNQGKSLDQLDWPRALQVDFARLASSRLRDHDHDGDGHPHDNDNEDDDNDSDYHTCDRNVERQLADEGGPKPW